MTAAAALGAIKARHGFITAPELQALADHPGTRLTPVLIRCGGGRFTTPAQDAQHFVDIVTHEGTDYVRDLSMVAGYGYPAEVA